LCQGRQKLVSRERVQITNLPTEPEKGFVSGLCVECALRHHDFREILRRGTDDYDLFSETPLPEAWIAGRHYRLLPCAGGHETMCSECNRSMASLYMPAK
jgi:hypothetical protein